jgi:hypothetical protein
MLDLMEHGFKVDGVSRNRLERETAGDIYTVRSARKYGNFAAHLRLPGQCTAGKLTHGVILRHRGRQTRAHEDGVKKSPRGVLAASLVWPRSGPQARPALGWEKGAPAEMLNG